MKKNIDKLNSTSELSYNFKKDDNSASLHISFPTLSSFMNNEKLQINTTTNSLMYVIENGSPIIPYVKKEFYLPEGYSLSYSINEGIKTTIKAKWDIYNDGNNQQKVISHNNIQSHCSVIQETYRGNKIISVIFYPILCDDISGTIEFVRNFDVNLHFECEDPYLGSQQQESDEILSLYTALVDTKPISKAIGTSSIISSPERYIIFTTKELLPAAEKLANWRRINGMDVTILSVSSASSDSIKSAIKSRYKTASGIYISYLLILGDTDKLRPFYKFSFYNLTENPTDYPFACMDDKYDCFADFCFGRIPAKTLDEAQTIVDKIIQFERHPIEDAYFYKRGLHCSWYQDQNFKATVRTPGHEYAKFLLPQERIRYYLTNYYDKEAIRIYTEYYSCDSLGRKSFCKDDPIFHGKFPEDLASPSFRWSYPDNGADEISKVWKEGCHYVTYNSHGLQLWCHSPKLHSDDILKIELWFKASSGILNQLSHRKI